MTIETSAASAADELDLFTSEPSKEQSSEKKQTPNKYEGKSVEELIQMNEDSQKHIGRLGNEVGSLRKLSDQILELKTVKRDEPRREERKPVTVETLLNDPDKSLRSLVDEELTQKTRAQEERLNRLEQRLTERDFTSKHGSYEQDLNDPDFKEWVAKSKLKQGLANIAADERNPGRFDAASELWDMWEERKSLLGDKHDKSSKSTKRVPSTVRSTPTENHKPKTFSRAKLMELRMKAWSGDEAASARWNDPEFQRTMITAYQEDRVK